MLDLSQVEDVAIAAKARADAISGRSSLAAGRPDCVSVTTSWRPASTS